MLSCCQLYATILCFYYPPTTDNSTYSHTLSLHDALPISWIPSNAHAREQRIAYSADDARIYVEKVVGPNLRNDVLDAFLESAPAMLDFMRANTEVDFWVAPFAPDYHPDERGAAMAGRMLSPVAYDGRKQIGRASCRERVCQYV